MILVLAACATRDADPRRHPADVGEDTGLPTTEGSGSGRPGSTTDTAWWTDTGGSGSCTPDPDRCDLDCQGGPDPMAVLHRSGGATLAFADVPAALSVAADGDEIVLCPGTYPVNLALDRDVTISGWSSRSAELVPLSSTDPVVRVTSGHTLAMSGLAIRGCATTYGGSGSGYGGSGFSGGSGPIGGSGFSGGSGPAGGSGFSGGSGHTAYGGSGFGGSGATTGGWTPGGGGPTGGGGPATFCGQGTGVWIESGASASLRDLLVRGFAQHGIRAVQPRSLSITGSEIVHNGGDSGAGLDVEGCSGPVTLGGVRLSDNEASGEGGGLHVSECDVVLDGSYGATSVVGNRASSGAGVVVANGSLASGELSITGNVATSGGGLKLVSGSVDLPVLTIAQNRAESGGGIWSSGTCSVVWGSIEDNSADQGGGVYVADGELALSASVTGNAADDEGAGLYVAGSATLSGGAILRNLASSASAAGAVVAPGGLLSSDSTDWGTPFVDDNFLPDVYPLDGGANVAYDGIASFSCDSFGCSP